jgi:hypothetical protein
MAGMDKATEELSIAFMQRLEDRVKAVNMGQRFLDASNDAKMGKMSADQIYADMAQEIAEVYTSIKIARKDLVAAQEQTPSPVQAAFLKVQQIKLDKLIALRDMIGYEREQIFVALIAADPANTESAIARGKAALFTQRKIHKELLTAFDTD